MTATRRRPACVLALCLAATFGARAAAQEAEEKPPTPEEVDRATERGIAFLLRAQEADGSWAGMDRNLYYGMTALAAYTLLQCGVPEDHPAIQAALAFVAARPCHRTYDVGCTLMLLRALGEDRPKERVRLLARQLIETMGNGTTANAELWGYPFGFMPADPPNYTDLSNTQYALLGLRAAANCGEKVPAVLWEQVGKSVLELQDDYGSFCYLKGRKPTASMTVAGITSLLICAEQLEKQPNTGSFTRRLRAACRLAEEWLARNWSVKENLEPPRQENSGSNRWLYYYLHGLERAGALSGQRFLARHDWYAEGARFLIGAQNGNGSWGTPWREEDTNTCFALLFLVRGTATTEPAPRRAAGEPAAAAAAFDIGTNGLNPLALWVRNLGAAIEARLESGETVAAVEWRVNGLAVARLAPEEKVDVRLQRFSLRHALPFNGRHAVQAVMSFLDPTGEPAGEEVSAALAVTADGVEEPGDREAMRDAAANLIEPGGVEVAASSSAPGHTPEMAVDLRCGTSWRAAAEDREPWISVLLKRPVQAAVLKVCAAHPFLDGEADWARPREIDVRVNGGRPERFLLIDSVRVPQSIPLKCGALRSLRITVKSVYPGARESASSGFKEIGLFAAPHPEDFQAGARSEPLLPCPGRETAWRYRESAPPGEWFLPEFQDGAWRTGEAPFLSGLAEPGTAWLGPEMWLRARFAVPPAAAGRLVLQVRCDDTAEIYLNGVLAAALPAFTDGRYSSLPLLPAAQAALLPSGENVLAVHCRNTGGASFLDVRVSWVPAP